jgi:hypothetical protein
MYLENIGKKYIITIKSGYFNGTILDPEEKTEAVDFPIGKLTLSWKQKNISTKIEREYTRKFKIAPNSRKIFLGKL